LAERYPQLRVVGIDVLDRALALAGQAAGAAGCDERVVLRHQDVASLPDVGEYDLAWLPTAFIAEPAVRAGLARLRAALRPGGWLVVAARPASKVPVVRAVDRLQAELTGGSAVPARELAGLLRDAGFAEVVDLPTTPLAGTLLGARVPA